MSQTYKNLKFDDTIQCRIFSSSIIAETDWEQLCKSINNTIISKSSGYIWNRDEFRIGLPLQPQENDVSLPHLSSVTCFGDNIEDEWLIVFLLYEITKEYDHLIVQVEDCDGSFLLIEAAEHLPTWINSETADNRVFIYQNNIHIITPELFDLDNTMDMCDAIQLIANHSDKTIASPQIQEAVLKRISGYPQRIQDCMHKAIVKMPIEVAAILQLKPTLIAALTNSYCSHDFLDKKTINKVNYTNCIDIKVKFTKYLYAMLIHSKLVKGLNHSHITEKDKKTQLGFKLTSGLYFIMNRCKADIFDSLEYRKYIGSLKNTGYFKDNIEGSKEYQQLIEKAKSYYLTTECSMNVHVYNDICSLMSHEAYEEVKKSLSNCENEDLSEDGDDWLNINPNQLNELLTSRYGGEINLKHEDLGSSQKITSALTGFLNKSSDFEGIEMEKDIEDNKINFNANEFASCLQNMLNIVTGHGEIELDDDSDFTDDIIEDEQEIDTELKSKLCNMDNVIDNNTIINNFVQSMKEEGLSGPSSNVLKSIGINKREFLDSDDDHEYDNTPSI